MMTTELVGEDRNFGGNYLFVDLIPKSCWFTNVRSCICSSDWDKLRHYIYERVNYTCECCLTNTKENTMNGYLEAHERWEYDDVNKIQRLKRIVALCHQCHQSTHIGLATIKGKKAEATTHLQKVRNFTNIETNLHIKNAFSIWSERNKCNWNLDLSLIENNNIKLSTHCTREERATYKYYCSGKHINGPKHKKKVETTNSVLNENIMYIISDISEQKLKSIETYILEIQEELKLSYEFLEKIRKLI